MIKNILFDFGGVVITLSPDEATRRFEALGMSDASHSLDTYTQTGIFGELESGHIDTEQFRLSFSEIVGHEVTDDDCFYAWTGYCKDVPLRNLDALLRLRREGYRIILVSNTNPYMMKWALSEEFDGRGHPLSYYFDALYMSYKLGVMKPAEEYFHKVIESEGINANETLFLDDGERNIEMAAKMGLNTYSVKNGEDWTKRIYDYL